MENDEKRKKVIDELKRRKKIVEDYLDSIDDSSKDFKYQLKLFTRVFYFYQLSSHKEFHQYLDLV